MRVRAKQKIYYGKKDRHPGDTYDMDDREESEAKILEALGKIEIVAPTKAPEEAKVEPASTTRYRAAAMAAEEEPPASAGPMTTDSSSALTEGKRFYRRRDMRAEK